MYKYINQCVVAHKLRGFSTADLLTTIMALQDLETADIDVALDAAYANHTILKELKRRGIKTLG